MSVIKHAFAFQVTSKVAVTTLTIKGTKTPVIIFDACSVMHESTKMKSRKLGRIILMLLMLDNGGGMAVEFAA